ncbi:hypothetical protein PABY_12380 [Pyrodictium abyssi]|uniref:Uncharacterized protein n=1 Tax=Pyrodictium abyssi TaxID=54256 RepID=A0ABM8IVT7_9CREN|nr:hypothetical protein PABY_12380 [Pyrodictium abyssi]
MKNPLSNKTAQNPPLKYSKLHNNGLSTRSTSNPGTSINKPEYLNPKPGLQPLPSEPLAKPFIKHPHTPRTNAATCSKQ